MALSITFFIVAAVIILIWTLIEMKRMKHKIFAIFLIGLIIFTYVTFSISLQDHNVDLSTVSGWIDAGKLYFSWLGTVFVRIKDITAYAIGLDWKDYNKSVVSNNSANESVWDKLK